MQLMQNGISETIGVGTNEFEQFENSDLSLDFTIVAAVVHQVVKGLGRTGPRLFVCFRQHPAAGGGIR
jgi:hypothetical protein